MLDWHGSLVSELRSLEAEHLEGVDPNVFVNEWRRRSMRAIVGQVRPDFDMDDVHLRALDETVSHFGIPALDAVFRQRLWRSWHRVRTWPDFPQRLRGFVRNCPSSRSRCCRCPWWWTCPD